MKNAINASIVLYKNRIGQVKKAVYSTLKSKLISNIYLIDNSPTDELKDLVNVNSRMIYIFNNANLGFGRGHNIAIRESINNNVKYHLVLNPDVYFDEGVLEEIFEFMEKHKEVGLIAPKILYPDGTLQYQCRLLPTPFDLLGRRFLNFGYFKKFIEKRNEIHELRFTKYNQIMEVPAFQGSFLFIRTEVLKKVGLFDERFFMYMEDIDLSRRIYKVSKNVFYPYVHIYHEWQRGSYKNKKLLKFHIESAIKYFNKWGWVFDKERDKINQEVLSKLGF
ncbi:MAG: glycosyltransferase family 2 protein, partial [Sulfurihydrogenibium sp.]|uniref:glycosyltransferase family 2 protein n=1 Tax=Sulfurihydrogenibium sp. TaxID=2053621 RepID=UPI003D13EAB7